MSAGLLFSFVIGYFLILLVVAWYTSRNSNNESFFIGNRNSNWMLVAFGMIGTSLSGVTFVSVPGGVGNDSFAYFQIMLGYLVGYLVIAYVLLPLYYRLNLTSIYNYLSTRLGFRSYKTGAGFFILSRTLGATARLYLVVKILQDAILSSFDVPFWLTTLIILLMILIYTYEGGVKTIVFTDTLQTTFMLTGLIVCVVYMLNAMDTSLGSAISAMGEKGYSKIFFTDPGSKLFFVKQILAGAFITITMTGMDQEMMQKNISVKRLGDSQKNVVTLSVILLFVIMLFLVLGGLLFMYAESLGAGMVTQVVDGKEVTQFMLNGQNVGGDKLFPAIALQHMPPVVSVIFIIALISALFPSADGAITALTSSFCIDIIGMQRKADWTDPKKKKIRQRVHLVFALIFLVFVMVFNEINSRSMIDVILKVAAYTYGPLLGLFTFGILTSRSVNDRLVPLVCIVAPLICLLLEKNQASLFGNFRFGPELLIVNGLITMGGLLLVSSPARPEAPAATLK
ncbi:MAG: sodium:solute symporter [Chitinophagaceae bacterium]|nr:MAG: sodium:solute symporter [Chitinophagaceae bacterium]